LKQWVKIFQETGRTEAFERLSAGAKGVKNSLKGKRIHFKSVEEERDYYKEQTVEEYIYFYNYKRFQKRLSYLAPIEYRQLMAA